MANDNLDRMFAGALRTNTGPIIIELDEGPSWCIKNPDAQLGYELSLAFQSYYRRRQVKRNSNKK